jgi:hypothetical protein
VLKQLCGCTADIAVTTPSSWLELVAAAYPGLQPAAFAANILAMCNRNATVTTDTAGPKKLASGQSLRGICTTVKGKSFLEFLNDARQQTGAVKASLATHEAARAAPTASVLEAGTINATTACTIKTTTSTAPVRTVELANSCPVYTNGYAASSRTAQLV